ncbi:PrsW family intramembrane metalloprotease [Paractinoplanes brasiliensis]|uniref:RsiW-degrading membrane proteinase PrsW (M82 family) n=1 Tax=Paractinoplanes brasiliensis TaxID=52695 RepID=A0A4R6JLZ5_9ACTN|nr:PrsW family glutamic-type intramembrane protease [Actinoplanes brasiliensis]TDO37354.1 RsiW-degrading membrane proteinase PrsW (M82 family) [Actinoplanes brasiliensis]GID29329.1 protease PrsW [Actinoplanes brasiliensis]
MWLLVLAVGAALFEIVRRTLVDTQNPNLVPALLLLGATIVPAAFVTFIRGRRLSFSVGGGTVALIAFVGGVVGITAAGTGEFDALRDLGTLPMLAVGGIEESAKLIAPLLVLLFLRHRRPADGLLIGVASGAGFAALETMGYAFVALVQSQGDLHAVDGLLLLRGLLSPAAHMAWTGLTATALWAAATQHWRLRAVARFVLTFAVAVVLHASWDSFASIPAYVVIGLVSLGLLTFATHRLSARERAALAGSGRLSAGTTTSPRRDLRPSAF